MEPFVVVLTVGGILMLLLFLLRLWYFQGYYSKEIVRQRIGFTSLNLTVKNISVSAGKEAHGADAETKGLEFEQFIAMLFRRPHFKFKEWRSDKNLKGIYPESNRNPDMVWELKTRYETFPFAVECKWRSAFNDGRIKCAKDYQLQNYKRFEAEHHIPVFIALGVGGKPSDPAELYLIPLCDINSCELTKYQLSRYKRYSPTKQLYYNTFLQRLE